MNDFMRKFATTCFLLGAVLVGLCLATTFNLITFIIGLELMAINIILITRDDEITIEVAQGCKILFGGGAIICLFQHFTYDGWFPMVIYHAVYWFVFDIIQKNLEKVDEDE